MADLDDVQILSLVFPDDRTWFQCAYDGQVIWIGMTPYAVRLARSAYLLDPEQLAKARMLWTVQRGAYLEKDLIDVRDFEDSGFNQFLWKHAGLGPRGA